MVGNILVRTEPATTSRLKIQKNAIIQSVSRGKFVKIRLPPLLRGVNIYQTDTVTVLQKESRMTIKDIAKQAGVSISTVSHVVNKTRYVSPELEERVQRVIDQLDQLPNFIVKKHRNELIEVAQKYIVFLHASPNSHFLREVEKQIELLLCDTPYAFLPFNCANAKTLAICDSLLLRNPGTVGIIAALDDKNALTDVLKRHHLPLVVIGKSQDGLMANCVCSDTASGTRKAIYHLLRNGHERIAFLSGADLMLCPRFEAYRNTLAEHGITYDDALVHTNLLTEKQIFAVIGRLFEMETPPSALFVATYSASAPVFQYLSAHSIHCPQDVSVVCFNDFEWASLHTPPITTVRQDALGVAQTAISLLLEHIQSEDGSLWVHRQECIDTRLVIRSSTSSIARGPFGERATSIDSLQLAKEELAILSAHEYSAAISFHYTGKAWMDLLSKGITDTFRMTGISLIATTDAHFNPELQSRQLETMALLKPDIIIAIPTDNEKTAEVFKKVANSTTKLILITNVPDGLRPGDYVSCISVNERSHGRNIGLGLAEYMLANHLKKVSLLKHDANFYATNQRDSAAEQVLTEEYPQLDICATGTFMSEEDAYEATVELMRRHPETEALYIPWEGPAVEAMRALTDIGRANVVIATGDLDHHTALVLACGGMIKVISAQCPYEEGQAIALAAANAMLGKPTPSYIGIEPVIVTPNNLLKTWKQVFKEEPPSRLKDALRENPHYMASD